MPDPRTSDFRTLEALEELMRPLEARLAAVPEFATWRALYEAAERIRRSSGIGAIIRTLDFGDADSAVQTSPDSIALRMRRPSQADAAFMALRERGRPAPTKVLLRLVPRYGQEVGGENPVLTLSSIMSKDSRFTSVAWGNYSRAWWFADQPLPPEPERTEP